MNQPSQHVHIPHQSHKIRCVRGEGKPKQFECFNTLIRRIYLSLTVTKMSENNISGFPGIHTLSFVGWLSCVITQVVIIFTESLTGSLFVFSSKEVTIGNGTFPKQKPSTVLISTNTNQSLYLCCVTFVPKCNDFNEYYAHHVSLSINKHMLSNCVRFSIFYAHHEVINLCFMFQFNCNP